MDTVPLEKILSILAALSPLFLWLTLVYKSKHLTVPKEFFFFVSFVAILEFVNRIMIISIHNNAYSINLGIVIWAFLLHLILIKEFSSDLRRKALIGIGFFTLIEVVYLLNGPLDNMNTPVICTTMASVMGMASFSVIQQSNSKEGINQNNPLYWISWGSLFYSTVTTFTFGIFWLMLKGGFILYTFHAFSLIVFYIFFGIGISKCSQKIK